MVWSICVLTAVVLDVGVGRVGWGAHSLIRAGREGWAASSQSGRRHVGRCQEVGAPALETGGLAAAAAADAEAVPWGAIDTGLISVGSAQVGCWSKPRGPGDTGGSPPWSMRGCHHSITGYRISAERGGLPPLEHGIWALCGGMPWAEVRAANRGELRVSRSFEEASHRWVIVGRHRMSWHPCAATQLRRGTQEVFSSPLLRQGH
mmetsp:Transcript_5905/g.16875  ORF Transcript_5905/g.16875 Transcript_5905/m.16875 type:complete len:205 (+) Transcript_5905:37-651(+)